MFCRQFMDPHGTHDAEAHVDLTLLENKVEHAARVRGYRNSQVELQHLPMIMAHDAGTGYGMENFAISFLTQTQSGSFAQQLDCGVRAFDVRPFMKTKMTPGKSTPCSVNKCGLKMHHGEQVTTASLEDALRDVLAWSATHQDEFVLLLLNSFGTDDSARWSWEKIWDEIVRLCELGLCRFAWFIL